MTTHTELAVGEATCVVYSHTFNNETKYFGNGVSEKRAFKKGGRGKKYLEQFTLDPNPKIEILATGLTPSEADALEQKMFDEYIASDGMKLQKRPSCENLQRNISRSNSDAYRRAMDSQEYRAAISAANRRVKKGVPRTAQTKTAIAVAKRGIPLSAEHRAAISAGRNANSAVSNRKVISMLDGRITSHAMSSNWNKKNPDYVGTWIDL